ncbi:ABC transporter ATP-binding protein [Amycolatopsis echigonensis]|uniref:ATP-binding cassette domain-containing protein n=1 Tax=Amycolatopsis echigonensis TaxID=2576905 RepID=A0A8E1W8E4_9PSEU|nr:ATP-binding cassette domain-containing protein [Amycolatopsis echigonensis]MBB2505792.1 ATP-binding cassette domain-containing protein [Amycolatopsis echigonensis]
MTTAMEFCEFGKQYGRVVAVHDLSFTVRTGRVVGLIGPNGAGKSTSLRGLLGLIRPTTGYATVFGQSYARLDAPAQRIGVHMDGLGFETGMTGRRHLEICAVAAGVSRQRVEPVLEEVGLADVAGRRLGKYSTGMKQRLGLASALLGEPELLVLDEPANGLDPEGIRWLRKLLRSYAERGGTVLLSSHQLAELAQTVDEVVIINRSAVFSGSLDELTDGGKENLEDRYFDLVGVPREASDA